ncbi:MAG: excisionase family DNA-binding protein [Actinobacteria bacterium]|nr:excisionase family DNA-binding protein [Actinomycetota bacterium]
MAPLAEAAERLGVSDGQVRRLIANRELRAKRFGRSWAVDLASVDERLAAKPGRGRPLGANAAWRRLQAAGDECLDLDDLPSLAVQVRRRADEQRFRILPFRAAGLRSDVAVVVSGGPGAAAHGAAVDAEDLDVYVRRSDLSAVVERHGLRPELDDVNVVVRIVDDEVWPFGEAKVAPLIVCALDSFERLDRRAAHEALVRARS